MLDIKFVRENPDVVKENMMKKFEEHKVHLVNEVLQEDKELRQAQQHADDLRSQRKKISKQIGALIGQGKKEEAEEVKEKVKNLADELDAIEEKEEKLRESVHKKMLMIPNIIEDTVPIGKDDSENVELERFGEPKVPDYEIPYHTDIMERLNGIDLDSARKVAGNGFYYLTGDIARLHSAVLSYARDFMIGRFIDTIIDEKELPYTLTSYSPCFRKEKGAHGIEERGVYRIHQFEKQEMIVVCKPSESKEWFKKLYMNTVDFFRTLDIPVRTLECCSGDLADLKSKSVDVEAWSPRQKKYFEVGSCSNLTDAQARRLKIRVRDEDGNKYFAHTLNNTCVAPPRMLIAFLENNLQEDGTVLIPEALQPYMGGKKKIG